MVKCEVIVDRASLVVGKGSIVVVDERQYELARQFLKPVEHKEKVVQEQKKVEEINVVNEEPKKDNKQKKK